jgi:radical SAM superfamily enzyme YgiQ (UPF0313 family)
MKKVTPKGKDVVIIYPKFEQEAVEKKPILPLQALAISGPLLREGFEVKILDERIEEDLVGTLSRLENEPICFGISCMYSYQPRSGLNIAKWIRRNFPGIPIVWGGWFPTLLPQVTIADPHVSIIVKGKGETTFTELVTAMYNKQTFDKIQGLIYKDGGKVIETPDRPLEDPNTFPPKPYHLLDLKKYCTSDGVVNFNSSYGCPFRCKFCGISAALKRRWNKGLTPERALDEIEDLITNYGIKLKHIVFQEDNFFNNRERAEKILQLFVKRGLNITWDANMRIDQFSQFDSELFSLIKLSGGTYLRTGAESAYQQMLDIICKDITVDQIEKCVEIARDYDIQLALNFIAGLPGETENGFRETLEKIKHFYKINPKLNTAIFQYYPIPGTPLYEMEKEQGLINEPKTFEEWADIAAEPMSVTPLAKKNKLAKYTNEKFKIMSFYFSFAYQDENIMNGNRKIIEILKKIFQKISVFRFEKNLWLLPLEWYIARLLRNKNIFRRWKKYKADYS